MGATLLYGVEGRKASSTSRGGQAQKNIDFAAKASCGILVSMSSVVSQDPEILGGEPVFTGTRVPVKSHFESFGGW